MSNYKSNIYKSSAFKVIEKCNDGYGVCQTPDDGLFYVFEESGDVLYGSFWYENEAKNRAKLLRLKKQKKYANVLFYTWSDGTKTKLFSRMPKGWKVKIGTLTQPVGTVWICNNQPLFTRWEGRCEYNPSYQQALLIVDKKLFFARHPDCK